MTDGRNRLSNSSPFQLGMTMLMPDVTLTTHRLSSLIQKLDRLPVSMQRPDIYIRASRSNSASSPSATEVCIDQRAHVLVLLLTPAPQLIKLPQDSPVHFESAPYPGG